MKLNDAIKWRAHNLLLFLYVACKQSIWQTYQTLRITSALLELKNKKKQIQERNSAVTLIFKQYHVLPDSIVTLCTPYYLSLIVCFLNLFSL